MSSREIFGIPLTFGDFPQKDVKQSSDLVLAVPLLGHQKGCKTWATCIG